MKKVVIIFLFLFIFSDVNASRKEVTFVDCVDGDTIKVNLDGKKTTVRFLAVDTPETVHPTKGVEPYGKEASKYTCDRVTNAKKIEIEFDPKSDEFDKYDRALGWIFVDDSLLQKELISNGYAKVDYLYGDYIYTEELKQTEAIAKDEKKGIWSDEKETVAEKPTEENKEEEKTFLQELTDLITKYITNFIKDLVNDIKKAIKEEIEKIFN